MALSRLGCDVSLRLRRNRAGISLRLNLIRLSGETGHKTSDAVLELTVLGGVDERVDAAVGDHQHHSEVVEPASIINREADETEKK